MINRRRKERAYATINSPNFWAKVDNRGDCWQWTGGLNTSGYGQMHVPGGGGVKVLAYHVTYIAFMADIKDGQEIDHRCGNRACVNPSHLRAVTKKQNQENRRSARRDNRSSGLLGATWCEPMNKWRARVQHDGKGYSGGYFECKFEAAEAARQLRNRLYTHNDWDRRAA